MLDTSRKADKAIKGCYTHFERHTRPRRKVRHSYKGGQVHDWMLDAPRKADNAKKEC